MRAYLRITMYACVRGRISEAQGQINEIKKKKQKRVYVCDFYRMKTKKESSIPHICRMLL